MVDGVVCIGEGDVVVVDGDVFVWSGLVGDGDVIFY